MQVRAWLVVSAAAVVLVGGGFAAATLSAEQPPLGRLEPAPEPEAVDPLVFPGVPLGDDTFVDDPAVVDNLAVFPIYAARAEGPEMVALDRAIAASSAEVREIGEVGQLVFRNDGDAPVIAVSGLVLGGGFQDRMVVRDFVLEPKSTATVAVRCAEHHRWSGARNGKITGGKFWGLPTMTGTYVRTVAERAEDQGEVWKAVDAVNRAHCKKPPTAALAGTLEDPALSKAREAVATEIVRHLDSLPMQESLVGLAYAVDGDVRDVRAFATSGVFRQLREALARTAALEALVEPRATNDVAARGPSEMPPRDQVAAFVRTIRDRPLTTREVVTGSTSTRYLYAHEGHGAIASWAPSGKRALVISRSFVAHPAETAPPPVPTCANP
jgi:hypothetical protein